MTTIPTISTLYNDILIDLGDEFTVTVSPTGKTMLRAIAAVLAACLKIIYLFIGQVQKNVFVDSCDPDQVPRWGRVFLDRDPFNATAGIYQLAVIFNSAGTIRAGTTWRSDDNSTNPNFLFVLDTAFTAGSPDTYTLVVRALTAGLASEMTIGDTMTATSPLLYSNQQGTVIAVNTTPIDAENIEDYRSKCIDAIQEVPGSWSAIDYRLVGRNVDGVKQIYAYTFSGHNGQVNVWIEGDVYGSPPSSDVITNVGFAIEEVRPLTAIQVNYAACPIDLIDITIVQIATLTTDQKTAVTAALTTAINMVRPFIAACDNLANRNDSFATNYSVDYCTVLQEVISVAIPTIPFGAVTFTVNSSSETTYTSDNGNIPYCSSVTYI
jgi:hypothetical protein